jgi:hypothetical protein
MTVKEIGQAVGASPRALFMFVRSKLRWETGGLCEPPRGRDPAGSTNSEKARPLDNACFPVFRRPAWFRSARCYAISQSRNSSVRRSAFCPGPSPVDST